MSQDEAVDKKRLMATQGRRPDGAPGGRPSGPEGQTEASQALGSTEDLSPTDEPRRQPTEGAAAAAELGSAEEREDGRAGQPGQGGGRLDPRQTARLSTAPAGARRRRPDDGGLDPVPEEGGGLTEGQGLEDAGGFALAGSTEGSAVADRTAAVLEDPFYGHGGQLPWKFLGS